MSTSAWKATLQNGYRVEFDHYQDDNLIEMFVSPTSDENWFQQIPTIENRTPEDYDSDRIWVATLGDGDQILVDYRQQTGWQTNDEMTIAYRQDRWMSWGPPVTCQPITVTAGDIDDI